MFKDDEKIVVKRILDDKDKMSLDYTYTGRYQERQQNSTR